MTYDYYSAVKADVAEYINFNINIADFESVEDLYNHLSDCLWVDDSVTGNASGSYTCNAWVAEEYIAHNWELLSAALFEFGCDRENIFEKGAEWCDVTIRCYVLGSAIWAALDDMSAELYERFGEML